MRRIVCFVPPEREDDTTGQSAEHPRSECVRDVIERLHKHTHAGKYMYIRAAKESADVSHTH